MKKWSLAAAMSLLACVALVMANAHGQVKQGKTRRLTAKTLMKKVVKPFCTAVDKAIKPL